jgi:undecaprenyl-diphosphatase
LGSGSLSISSAAFLGVVQGLTEFLPVSSSGHLVLLEKLFNFNPETPQMLLFDLAVHLGTVIAILIVFHKSAVSFVKNLVAFDKYDAGKAHTASSKEASQGTGASGPLKTTFRIYRKNPAVRLLVLAVCATFVTGVSGLALKEQFVRARGSLRTVACMWVITGTLLVVTDVRRRPRLGLRQFSAWHAVIVGLAQAAAILPGISRSGVTICAAILLGLRRRWAVEFSFLLAVPAILGAATHEFLWEFRQSGLGALSVTPLLVGIITAAATGTIALNVLLNAARNANLKVFGFYCYILAAFVLIYLLW